MGTAIKVDNLIKSYGDNIVIKDISFEVEKGEIFALLGANGAGKTTTLECIEGLRKYNSGSITKNGKIGVQLQSSSLQENIKVIEVFKLFSLWNKANIDMELFKNFGLDEIKNKQYNEMSTGQKRRLHLALALIKDPDIIFLDEPTSGLDVEGRVSLHGKIRNLKEQGKTIIMASHDMAEVESLCDRIAILRDGKIVFIGTPKELTREKYSQSKIYLKTMDSLRIENLYNGKFNGTEGDYSIFITTDIGASLLEILEHVKFNNNKVLDLKIERATLEERFIQLAKEGK